MSLIKPGIWSSGPDDSLVKKDVYREDVLAASNTYTETPDQVISAASYLKNANVSPNSITQAIKDALKSTSTGTSLDMGVLRKRLERSLNIPGSLADATQSQKNAILKELEAATGTKGLKVSYQGIESSVRNLDAMSASSIVDVLDSLTGSTGLVKLLDLDAEAAGLKYFLGLATDWGLVDLVDAVLAKSETSKELNALLEEQTLRAAKNGNVQSTFSLMKKMGHSRSYAIRDDIIKELISNFKIGVTDERSHITIGQELVNVFTWIDPNWDRDTSESNLYNIRYYMMASTDAQTVLLQLDNRKCPAAGSVIRTGDIESILKITMPDTAVL